MDDVDFVCSVAAFNLLAGYGEPFMVEYRSVTSISFLLLNSGGGDIRLWLAVARCELNGEPGVIDSIVLLLLLLANG